ncbi:MAG TPA: hypothetical protein VG738_04035 [Chitinophagaceae bacterium]|nr:hypothetical protein [Chitinophagaceae bacterium]
MDQQNNFLDEFEEKQKLSTLKTLTILTFIGSGLAILSSIWTVATAESSYQKMQDLINSGKVDQLPSFVKDMYSPERMEMMRKSVENKIPIFIIGIIAGALCIFGAMQMRKLKAEGYWIWLIGEILPFLGIVFFLGVGFFSGVFMWITLVITGVFVLLYSLQKKNLTR